MKDLKEAKVGDEVVHLLQGDGVVIGISEYLTVKFKNGDVETFYFDGTKNNYNRTLFYKGQITENEYLGLSADGVKMFYGMPTFSFHLTNDSRCVIEFTASDCDVLKEHGIYSAAYSTKEAAEKAQKEHFKHETFPLPDWLTVLSFDKCPSIRVGSLPFRFSIYNNGWGKVPTDYTGVIPACFIRVQFSELKDGDFFTLGADLDYILMKINNEKYVRITNRGEVINHNLGKLSEVFKVVASEIEKEPQRVAIGTLSVGEKFLFEAGGNEYVIYGSESGYIWYEDNYGRMFENNYPSEMVYKIQNNER